MLFKYRGFNKSGKKAKGTVTASSVEEAGQKLRTLNIYYESLIPSKAFSFNIFSKRQMPTEVLSTFSTELSSYLNSGMTLLTAMKLQENQHEGEKSYVAFLNSVHTMIDEGKSLFHALQSQNVYTLPDFYLQSLKVAAEGGTMVEVLTNMAHFFSAQNRVKAQVKAAMVYPAVIFVVALVIIGFLLVSVVPKITQIFEDTDQVLPQITQVVVRVSDFLIAHYLSLSLAMLFAILLIKLLYANVYSFHKAVDEFMLRLPLLGSLIQNHELGRFSYILSLMLGSGVAYAQAVQLSKDTFSNYVLKERFNQAAAKVIEGNKLSHALQFIKGVKLKRNFMQSLALGEESSEVSHVLANLSELYARENDEKIKILLSLLNPAMMLFIGGFVGIIIASMMLPIFTMTQGLK